MISHPQAFLYSCISFILGIFCGSFFYSIYVLFIFIIFSITLIGILWRKKHILLSVFFILIFCLGYFYINMKMQNILENEITNYFNLEIEINGKVIRTPKDDLEIKKAIIEVATVNGKEINSNVLIFTNKNLNHGDKIIVLGKLTEPESFNNFNYKMYLANQGISGIIKDSKVEIISEHHSFIFDFKNKAEQIVLKNLSISKAGILNATILGETDNMNSELKQKLAFAGISQVVAISGQHIILLCVIMLGFLKYLKVERKRSIILTFVFILFYTILIDFPASALRAFIMMSFVLFAELIGRESDSLRSLVFAALLILIFNPLALLYDLGFQLSFLAVLGIIFFNNFFKSKLSFIKNGFLNDLVAVNFSAQVFVLPLLVYTFGYISLSSFITNILVVPISTILLVFGFLCVVFSLIIPSLSFLFFIPITLILDYILFIVDKFSFMIVEINNFPLIFLIFIYLIFIFTAYKLRKDRFEFSI